MSTLSPTTLQLIDNSTSCACRFKLIERNVEVMLPEFDLLLDQFSIFTSSTLRLDQSLTMEKKGTQCIKDTFGLHGDNFIMNRVQDNTQDPTLQLHFNLVLQFTRIVHLCFWLYFLFQNLLLPQCFRKLLFNYICIWGFGKLENICLLLFCNVLYSTLSFFTLGDFLHIRNLENLITQVIFAHLLTLKVTERVLGPIKNL